ncbi:Hypothetical predicted protein [Cloeon dipterum]|uniref:protein-tyrosine-phosphatase n=1 Tax=Cloeon dipterum TaxID=197152 RepID=A0A8S1BZZ3_9INSE|nr:Hypothetical predicted protein [Cloeon dipterum]
MSPRVFSEVLATAVVVIVLGFTTNVNAASVYDIPHLRREKVFMKAGANASLACPGVGEQSIVINLEWLCMRCGSSGVSEIKLVEFMGESTTVWEHRGRISLNQETFSLNLQPVLSQDSGEYVCLVNNRPTPEAIVKLVVQDVPPPPARPLITNFTSRSVYLSWAPPLDMQNGHILHYIISIRVGEDGGWDEDMSGIETSDNKTFYTVANLRPFTVYSFRIIAVNALGPSKPSKESFYMVTLREVPDGKPTITTAHNTSATSIHISWRPPTPDSIHGEFLGYRVAYRQRDRSSQPLKEIFIRDPNVNSFTIQNLDVYSQYLVSLQVFNPEGHGPSTTVLVMTDEGVPSRPQNLTITYISSRSVGLAWSAPEMRNGRLLGYRLYYLHNNFTDSISFIAITTPITTYNLTGLTPNGEYKIWVKAFTYKNEGEPSIAVDCKTDIAGPGPPKIVNLTCLSEDSLLIQWTRPAKFFKNIDYYYLMYRSEDSFEFNENVFNTSASYLKSSVCNIYFFPLIFFADRLILQAYLTNLTTDKMYEVKVRGAVHSELNRSEILQGDESLSRKILLKLNCDKEHHRHSQKPNELSAGVIAGIACAAFAMILALVALVLWRKCFRDSYNYLDDLPPIAPNEKVDWDITNEDGVKTTIPINHFSKHVMELHADGDIAFSKEYEAIQAMATKEEIASEFSQHPDNKQKNRYLNITAYDHSRVRLMPAVGQKKAFDYINANYIDGFQKSRAYIGTQGPLPSTFDCFWRMIWEQRVAIIVMITNLVERGRRKCDMYWPKEGIETYGVVQVKLIKEDVMATYTVRTLHVKHTKLKKKKGVETERTVKQYHYTNWPDHGTPDHPLPVLSFVKKSSAANPLDAGPIVVHCSAGVGRTGTYIVLDAMLKQIAAKSEVNIYGFLRHIRTQRNFLVQTEEQYIFIHDALLEAIEFGNTCIGHTSVPNYIINLLTSEVLHPDSTHRKLLDSQFSLLTGFAPQDFHLTSATKQSNGHKNRSSDLLPLENSRVHLTPKPAVDGSDYINACWIHGFHKLKEFIITQHPMEATVMDFWQMVWDHNAQTIVMLSDIDNTIDQPFLQFWPNAQDELENENFKVKFVDEFEHAVGTCNEMTIQSLHDDYELRIKMVRCPNWPHSCGSMLNVFDLLNFVQEWHMDCQNGPVVVIDRFGGTEAATFCCLTSLTKQLEYESNVDVYMYAKLYHNKRPGIWKSQVI